LLNHGWIATVIGIVPDPAELAVFMTHKRPGTDLSQAGGGEETGGRIGIVLFLADDQDLTGTQLLDACAQQMGIDGSDGF
jgi:hypothetical protein